MSVDRPDPNAATIARQTGDWHAQPHGVETPAPALSLPAHAVPGYELLGEVGRGGMGVVYRARHLGLNRIVALKMVLAGAHARGADLQRFRAEAEAVARLQHPNVVQVYDVGEANGLPYLSLELCAGSLADRLDGTPWPPKPAAELVETLARAVEAAHQAGVLHRDIKPANVLMSGVRSQESGVSEGDRPLTPDSCLLTPKLTDFGLAKRIDGSGAGPTATGAILGTPSYMAPEQAGRTTGDGRPRSTGPAIDVYALGAILYELLTGRPPFLAASPLDTLLQVTRDDPVPPARLNPKTPRDIQTICLKCLEKEPGRRYPTAAALADDLHRYLHDEPITARPAARWERAWKWAKRRPARAGLIAVSVAAVVALIAGSWYFTGQLSIERDAAMRAMNNANFSAAAAFENAQRAEAEALNARRRNYVLAMGQAQLAWQQAAVGRLRNLLAGQVPKPGHDNLRGFEWHYWDRIARGAPRTLRTGNPNPVIEAVAYSPDGHVLGAATRQGNAYFWDTASWERIRVIDAKLGWLRCLAFGPHGRQVALGGEKEVALFDTRSGAAGVRFSVTEQISSLAFSPDGAHLAVQSQGPLRLFDAAKGQLVQTFERFRNGAAGGGVGFTPDGRRLVAGGFPARVWDVATGELVRELTGGKEIAVSPDGERVAALVHDWDAGTSEVRILNVATGKILARGRGHAETCRAVAFNPEGTLVASAGDDNTVRLWDPATGKEVRRFQGGSRWNSGVAFSPDGRSLAVCSYDDAVEVWPVDYEQEATTVKAHTTFGTRSLALFSDADRVLGAGLFTLQVDDVSRRKTLAALLSGKGLGSIIECGAVSADGLRVAAGFDDGTVMVWDAATGRRLRAFDRLKHGIRAVTISADGRRVAAASRADLDDLDGIRARPAGESDRVVIWDVESGSMVRELAGADLEQVNAIALSGDGQRLVTGSGKLTGRLWDVDSGQLVHTFTTTRGFSNWGTTVTISPDGRWAAFAHSSNSGSAGDSGIQMFDNATGKLAFRLEGNQRTVRKLAFGPDSGRLASAGYDNTVRVWDVVTGQEVLSRPAPRNVVDLKFSRDGRRLSAVTADGTLRTWSGD